MDIITENGRFSPNVFYDAISSRHAISRHDEAEAATLTALELPDKLHKLAQVLIGLSGGKLTRDIPLLEVGRRMWETSFDRSLEGTEKKRRERQLKNQTRKAIRELTDWQTASRITLFEYIEGTKIGDDYLDSSFVFHVLPLIQKTMQEFRTLAKDRRPQAMARAARVVAEREGANLTAPSRRRRTTIIPNPDRHLKSALTFVDKYATECGDAWTAYDHAIDELIKRRDRARQPNAEGVQDAKSLVSEDLPEIKGVSLDANMTPETTTESRSPFPEIAGIDNKRITEGQRGLEGPVAEPISTCADEGTLAVEIFASVGGTPDQVLLIDDTKPKPQNLFKKANVTAETFPATVCRLSARGMEKHLSLIVRIRGTDLGEPCQLDDLTEAEADFLRPFSFLSVETSPGSFQNWLAFKEAGDKDETRTRLLQGMKILFPETRINPGSGGAVRWPGTPNFKPSRKLQDSPSPLVRIAFVNPGRFITPAELDQIGLLTPKATPAPRVILKPSANGRWWPNYEVAKAGAPTKADGSIDLSVADARFVTKALVNGWPESAVIEKLREVSEHARELEPEKYSNRTVNRVARWLETNKGIKCEM